MMSYSEILRIALPVAILALIVIDVLRRALGRMIRRHSTKKRYNNFDGPFVTDHPCGVKRPCVASDDVAVKHNVATYDVYSMSEFEENPEMHRVYRQTLEAQGAACATPRQVELFLKHVTRAVKKECAVLFPSRAEAITRVLQTFAYDGSNVCVVYDEGCNAATVRMIKANANSEQSVYSFVHNIPSSLKKTLFHIRERSHENPIVVVVEGIYGTSSGSLCPIKEMCAVTEKYGASILLDDTFGFGVRGEKRGMGTLEVLGSELSSSTSVVAFTVIGMENACMASQGGICLASKALSVALHRTRSQSEGTTLYPSAVHVECARHNLFSFLNSGDSGIQDRRRRLRESVEYIHQLFQSHINWDGLEHKRPYHVITLDYEKSFNSGVPLTAYDIQAMLVEQCGIFVMARDEFTLQFIVNIHIGAILQQDKDKRLEMMRILFPRVWCCSEEAE